MTHLDSDDDYEWLDVTTLDDSAHHKRVWVRGMPIVPEPPFTCGKCGAGVESGGIQRGEVRCWACYEHGMDGT